MLARPTSMRPALRIPADTRPHLVTVGRRACSLLIGDPFAVAVGMTVAALPHGVTILAMFAVGPEHDLEKTDARRQLHRVVLGTPNVGLPAASVVEPGEA
jgi:hypothetical protein